MENESLYQLVVKEYMDYGYQRAQNKVNELYDQDKISLVQKGKMMDNLTKLQMMTSKQKKFFKHYPQVWIYRLQEILKD